MSTQMEEDATTVLHFVVDKQEQSRAAFELLGQEPPCEATGQEIHDGTGLPPGRVNDAVALLENSGYAEVYRHMGTAPYDFGEIEINALGRFELQRAVAASEVTDDGITPTSSPATGIARQPHPIGSPYGFTEADWEFVENEALRRDRLKVVFGHQWQSERYSTTELRTNVQEGFASALVAYNAEAGNEPAELVFVPLSAGYGEHLFNEIVRDILSADIAVFDTSDWNPNVMIEMGIALTWGVRVHPIKLREAPEPPSDISGQTWASYGHDGTDWDDGHDDKLLGMVRRAMRRKAR